MTEELYEGPDAPAVAADPTEPDAAGDNAATEVAALRAEWDEYHDRLLRKAAEFENYRKRAERSRRDLAEQATGDLLIELLALADDFERALTVDPGTSAEAYRRGVELISAKVQDLLRRHEVHPIEAVGRDFDPNLHQAVVHEPTSDYRDGEVMEELRRGYMRGDRLLRPAMVKVAKA